MTQHLLTWLSPSPTRHVSLALLHSLWQGTLLALVVAGVLRLLRDQLPSDPLPGTGSPKPVPTARANVRYAIACMAFLGDGGIAHGEPAGHGANG